MMIEAKKVYIQLSGEVSDAFLKCFSIHCIYVGLPRTLRQTGNVFRKE